MRDKVISSSNGAKYQGHVVGLSSLIKRLWQQLSERRKKQCIGVAALVVVSGLAEVVSLVVVLPFLAVLTAPERLLKYPSVHRLMYIGGVTSLKQLVLLLAVAFALTAMVAGALRMLVLWLGIRIAYATGADFSSEVYRRTLYQPYQIHIMRNSSELISGITGKVTDTIIIVNQFMTLLNSLVLLPLITIALFVIDARVAGWRRWVRRRVCSDLVDNSRAVARQ